MSIKGASFNPISTGARMDFFTGSAGLANLFTSGFTIAVLAKMVTNSFGFLAGMSDSVGGTYQGAFFVTNNSGGRLFGDSDFSNGFPDSGVDADGINDGVWRWHVMSKPAGSAHYRWHYADLATLTWAHGESVGAANHGDRSAATLFTTGAIYPLGFDAGDIAAIVAWPSALSDGNIVASCTQAANDLISVANPKGGWMFRQQDFANYTYRDFTGGFADESGRQLLAASADPPGWTWHVGETSSLFNLTERPGDGHNNFNDADPGITTGVSFTVSQPGEIRAIRFVSTTGAGSFGSALYTAALWHVTSGESSPAATLLSTATPVLGSSIVADAWNEIALPTPIPVSPGNVYRAGVHNDAGLYVANNDYFGSNFDKISDDGILTAHHDSDNTVGFGAIGQGTFIIGNVLDYPRNVGSAANYWIDVVYGPASADPGTRTRFFQFF